MSKIRIPLPRQVEKIMDDGNTYKRQRDTKVIAEWEVNCSKCGIFIQEQLSRPNLCPHCHSSNVEISEN